MTEEEIDAFLEKARADTSPEPPSPISGEYVPGLDLIVLRLSDASRLAIPREQLEGLEGGTPEQLSQIEFFGDMVHWTALDVNHYLPELLEHKYSSERWKQAREQQAVAA